MNSNVFEELGFSPEEAAVLQMRAILAIEVEEYIKEHNLTQSDAANVFGVPQPTISKIVTGNYETITMEFLLKMLLRVGVQHVINAVNALDFSAQDYFAGGNSHIIRSEAGRAAPTNYDPALIQIANITIQ